MDSRIGVLLKTDVRRFAELVQRTFVQRNLVINDNLPLDRIECKLSLEKNDFTFQFYDYFMLLLDMIAIDFCKYSELVLFKYFSP